MSDNFPDIPQAPREARRRSKYPARYTYNKDSQAGGDAPSEGRRTSDSPPRDPSADEELPYPGNILFIIEAVAWVGFAIGCLAGLLLIITAGGDSDDYRSDDRGAGPSIGIGFAVLVGSAMHWTFFRATALVVEYLWRIQAQTAT